MTHVRQQLRNVIATSTLASMAASTGDGEIFQSRTRPISSYPAINVYSIRENLTSETEGRVGTPARYRRFYDIGIDITVQTNTAADDALDALCETAEDLLGAAYELLTGVNRFDLLSVDFTNDGDGDKAIQIARLVYRIEYRTDADDSSVFIQ